MDATFTSDPQNKYGKVGDTLSLSCEATGASAKVIEWYKDSTKISNGVSTSTANGVTTSSLTLMNVQLSDGSANYYCKAAAGHQNAVSSSKAIVGSKRLVGSYRILRNFCVLVLGSITSFSSRSLLPGTSSSRPFACTFTANPRPTSGELILDGKVEASLTQTIPNSGNSWTVSDPIQSITVEEGGNYTCVAKMESFSIVSYAQLGSELDQMTNESFLTSFFSRLYYICSTTTNNIRSRKNEDTDLQWHGISYTFYYMEKDTWKSSKSDSRQRQYRLL